jgi:ribonuclease HII
MPGAVRTMRTEPSLAFEQRLWKHGVTLIAGMDEAGRGALAGPVAVGVVVLPRIRGHEDRDGGPQISVRSLRARLRGVRDSKQMTPHQRENAAGRVKRCAVAWGVGFGSPEEIDSEGIVGAARLAADRALQQLGVDPDYLLTDFRLPLPELEINQTSLVRGDGRCLTIAAASVLAKTARDAFMEELDLKVPGYGLAAHKGYGTPAHLRALKRMGSSPIHRKSFSLGL